MCKNKRFFRNVYDGREYLTKCGHCEACLQEKALAHLERIKRECQYIDKQNNECFFVTLDYRNDTIPYILESEVRKFCVNRQKLNVYRNGRCIHSYVESDFSKYGKSFDLDFYVKEVNENLPFLHVGSPKSKIYLHDKVGVHFRKDVQLFFKRLKINLVRAGYKGFLAYFYTQDYGGQFKRPHTHFIIIFDKGCQSLVKHSIIKSWSYSDLSKPRVKYEDGVRKKRWPIEVAISPSNYIATYINLRAVVPLFMQGFSPFACASRFSNGFGTHFRYFTYDEVVRAFNNRYLKYPRTSYRDGVFTTEMARIPRYIISRYFPKFKGFRNLSTDEIFDIFRRPSNIGQYRKKLGLLDSDIIPIFTHLLNLKVRCFNETKKDYLEFIAEYPFVASRIWSLYSSESIKDSFDDCRPNETEDLFEHYVNIKDYLKGVVRNYYLDKYKIREDYEDDPNLFRRNLETDFNLKEAFHESVKHKNLKYTYYENFSSS